VIELGPNEYLTKEGLAAVSEEVLDKVTEYSVNGDTEAILRLIAAGQVVMMKPGQHVFLVDSSGFLVSKVKIRLKGRTAEVWTIRENITKGD
jgi:hypothetical protein